jgi:hypothetical protein
MKSKLEKLKGICIGIRSACGQLAVLPGNSCSAFMP